MVTVVQLYNLPKTHPIVLLHCVNLTVYKLYLNKAVFLKGGKKCTKTSILMNTTWQNYEWVSFLFHYILYISKFSVIIIDYFHTRKKKKKTFYNGRILPLFDSKGLL